MDKAPLSGSLCSFEHPREETEAELVLLAGHQHDCLHRRQLRAGGAGRKWITRKVHDGVLVPLLSDVFQYGRHQGDLTRLMAVLLHLRGDAVASSATAAWLWELTDLEPPQIEVLLVGRNARRVPDITLHRSGFLSSQDIWWRKGVPVTSPARSLLDFAATTDSPARVESALAMMRRKWVDADRQIQAALARAPANHHGAPLIRRLLALAPGELVLTRSIYERKLRELLELAGLPAPLSNQMVAGKERDLVWLRARLIVEFDGWAVHRDKFESDRARDAKAVAAGWRVIRITADRLDTEPYAVIAEISAALAQAA